MQKRNVLLGLMLGAVASASAQDLSTWPKYKNIAINTKASGANVAANVAKFPVLVRLDAANANDIFTEAAAGGADIRLANAAGVARPFEIESWDATNKRAVIWVLADSVKGNDSVAALRIYWGVSNATTASNPKAVFDTANGFVAVWHMNGSTNESDATANGFTATPFGDPAVNDSAAVGKGRKFNGTQYFQAVGTAASALNLGADAQYSLSAWVRADSVNPTGGTGHVIVNKGDHQWTLATYSGNNQAPNRWYEITTKANNTWNQTTTAPRNGDSYPGLSLNSHIGTWRYMTGTWNGTTPTAAVGRIYVDGKLENTTTPDITTHANGMDAGRSTTRDVHIGALSNQAANSSEATGAMERYWIGTLDEIRVSRVARDSNWIRLEFETQKPGASAVVLGATQTQVVSLSPADAAARLAHSFSVKSVAQGMTFQIANAYEGKAIVTLVDMWGRTVWSGAFAPGATQLSWNGTIKGGVANSGVYMARLTLLGSQGKTVQVYDRKVPYTR